MSALPQGTVTFLFTDIEGSTRLLQELGDGYAGVLDEHRRLLRDAFARHRGVEVDTQGDAFFVAFATASDAVAAAAAARDALAGGPVRIRMGLHTGEPAVAGDGYVGLDVHRAARIAGAGHGGQILVSQATRDLVGAAGLRDLGEHRLKDIDSPERIYQLGDDEFPALRSPSNTNLPLPPEPLIGRKKELADVLRAILEGARIVTVTGPGGVGKTRLALEVALELSGHFADGVRWVGLAPIRDPQLVLPAIATAVGAEQDLEDELRRQHVLLLLDNVEQVVDAATDVATLQRACPDLTLLVTSREPLHVGGEREYPLAPLAEAPAVELLRQRAESSAPDFTADYGALVQICDRLDRLPLAIELAAARTKAMSVDVLLQRLEQRLPLLTSRRRDVEERQQTLRATIEWSYELLAREEQQLFARLGVFAASFQLEAAEVICSADLDVLQSLVDKSLLRHGDEARYFMLATIKELALEKLRGVADAAALGRAHDDYFLALAEQLNEHERLAGDRDFSIESRSRFERELPNLRAAFTGLVEAGRNEELLRLGSALWRFWLQQTQYRDAAAWLEQAPLEDQTIAAEVRDNALTAAGAIAFYVHDDIDRAEMLWQEALDLRREQDDPLRVGAALSRLASVAWRRGDFDGAIAYHEQALRLFEQVGNQGHRLNELHFLGEAYRDRGDLVTGERLLEQTVELTRRLGLRVQLTNTLHSLGDLALDRGDPELALERFAIALTEAVAGGAQRVQLYCVAGIAGALALRGDDAVATRLWGMAEDQERQLAFRMLGTERQRYENLMAGPRERLGASYDEAHAAQVGLTLEQAVAEARQYAPSP
jgi:predicted ATPase/class 3 adenylate cyclase